MKRKTVTELIICTTFVAAGCADLSSDTTSTHSAAIGDNLPGLKSAEASCWRAREAFLAAEGIGDGVGPIFNLNACGGCHTNGAMGGAGEQIERRFGRFVNGIFDALENRGGSLRQLFTVANFNNPNLPAASRGGASREIRRFVAFRRSGPAEATVRNVGRRTQPLFGLGLVDAMPDSFFDGLAAAQPAAIRGTVTRVPVAFPIRVIPRRGQFDSRGALRMEGRCPTLSPVLG